MGWLGSQQQFELDPATDKVVRDVREKRLGGKRKGEEDRGKGERGRG